MARKTYEELEQLKKKLNTSRLWSFSRVNKYETCPYSYFLNYIKRVKEVETSIYALLGGSFHDILEKYYNSEITYDEMVDEADNVMLQVDLMELKFDKGDIEKNENIKTKYFECIRHFFLNHKIVDHKVLTEKEVIIKVGNHYFQGYIDAIHKVKYKENPEDENELEKELYYITDYKSSTIYTGEKIDKESKQLKLYALGLTQMGVPLEKIRIRWNFLKYCSASFIQKNGVPKTMHCERNTWIAKMSNQIRTALKDMKVYSDEQIKEFKDSKQFTKDEIKAFKDQTVYSEDEINSLVERSVNLNDVSLLPQDVVNKFTITDCYVEIPLCDEILDELETDLISKIQEIYTKEYEYESTNDETIWYKKVDDKCSYFCSNLCGYTTGQCPCYKEYLENREMFNKNKPIENNAESNTKEDSDQWLKDLGLI